MKDEEKQKIEKKYVLRAIVPIFIGGSELDFAMTSIKKRVDPLLKEEAERLKKILENEEKIVTILEEA